MNPELAPPDPDWDRDLAARLAGPPFPPTPAGLASRVRGRLRRRRLLLRAGLGAATAALLAAVLGWHFWPAGQPLPQTARGPDPEGESQVLDVAPPVGKLDLLAQHQAAYLEALEQMEKEF